ncbi:CPSF A subunit region-domain-containing protein [Rhodofomes roseus]|uniref:CPSF A subunit region-domain-containing protein n=1 Tax=Rhodofomes roseus TaxID=34475 RepID=A0ABQ8K0G9_9APHY|nr:CPSF A subunit region-domain-containing protein [Rhodofomes roseus]KAH9830080.1 CPSF A subunit region-domain-containing protein [Rhodofomes roseus]
MQALRQEILPPSGVEFAACLKLLPSTLPDSKLPGSSTSTGRALFNVVVARSNHLRIFEVREEPAPISSQKEDEKERRASVRKGTEAVEGEVEMDASGEGFVNMGSIKTTGQHGVPEPQTVTRFYLVREHRLHGIVTGIEAVRIVTSTEDNLDRLVVSFKDAKIALLEWSEAVHDLITVSLHTYERAPQLSAIDAPLFRPELRADPLSRCAALLLPKDSIAILPFYQSQAELDIMEQELSQAREVPYSPSFILDLSAEVDDRIRNVIDFVFLPGFNNPTVALLFQHTQTWTGRLQEYKDTVGLLIFTLDLVTHHYPVITVVASLPYDCFALTACSTSLGGVVVLAGNSILYVDQASRRIILPLNGWPARTSDMPMPSLTPDEQKRDLQIEGARFTFVDERTLYIFGKDGTVYPVEIVLDGKTVSRLSMAPPVARTTIPALVKRIGTDHLFIGSIVGPSVLLKTAHVEEEMADDDEDMAPAPATVVAPIDSMDLDEDEELYGTSTAVEHPHVNGNAVNGVAAATKKRTVVHLSLCDAIPAYGPIADMTFALAKNGDRFVPELVAATGYGALGGFTLLQRDLPTRTKRKIHAIGGARGMWSLPVRQPVKVNGSTFERPANPFHTDKDTLIISTDATPSPGLSRIALRNSQGEIQITTRIPGTTIGAASFFHGTAILHVMFNVANVIRVLEPDGSERQAIKDTDGDVPRPRVKFCSICDPFILIIREDDSIGLFVGEIERGKIRRKDMSPMGDKTSKYLAGCFFTDASGLFQTYQSAEASGTEGVTSTLQAAMDSGKKSQWLILVRPQGVVEIWTLPKLVLAFSTTVAASLEPVLSDSMDPVALSLPQDPPRKPQELDIEQILIAPLGESSPRPHLMVFMRSGLLAVYGVLPVSPPVDPLPNERTTALLVKFIKVATRAFDIQVPEEQEKTVLAEVKKISRHLVPFMSSPTPGQTFSGVFFTGDRPCWILATDKGGVKVFSSGHSVVHAFTASSVWESKGDFLLYSEEGPSLVEWIPDLQLDSHLPSRSVPRSRAYTNVVYDPNTSLIVAASSRQSRFASYDDDGNIVWEPDAPNVSFPYCDSSTLELLMPDSWITMDGYEFAQNEFVTCLDCVTLESVSTETGTKDFIAVGTTINRGEDLAVKGAVYIFEIVEVVPDVSTGWKRWHQLKLRCRDDAKGPVTALCGMDNYLVSSMGQKIFVRAFDLDERLVGVAFLDVGVYVTSLRTVKNLLLIGDAVKSIWFVAFQQEDPYKLVILGKDPHHVCVTSADLFFADSRVSLLVCDEDGVIRLYEYDPQDPESRGGQHLLRRTEFHGQTEYRTSALIARRRTKDTDIPQSKLICGSTDGSLSSFTYVDESAFKRLHLLQGQLTRNVQHVAGLNPKAFRLVIVRNDFVSKPLSKGILDGNLLSTFEDLSISRQHEMTRQIGTERGTVLKDWLSLNGTW